MANTPPTSAAWRRFWDPEHMPAFWFHLSAFLVGAGGAVLLWLVTFHA